jgi:hypothetical protein
MKEEGVIHTILGCVDGCNELCVLVGNLQGKRKVKTGWEEFGSKKLTECLRVAVVLVQCGIVFRSRCCASH